MFNPFTSIIDEFFRKIMPFFYKDRNPKKKFNFLIPFVNLNTPEKLFLVFLTAYVVVAFVFAFFYQILSLLKTSQTLNFSDYIYFSFITQATVGYGDMTPTKEGYFLVIIQIIFGIFFTAFATGAIFLKIITPDSRSVLFEEKLIFIRNENLFRTRLTTRLPLNTYKIEISATYRREKSDNLGNFKRYKVKMSTSLITLLEPRKLFRISFSSNKENIEITDKTPFVWLDNSIFKNGKEKVTLLFSGGSTLGSIIHEVVYDKSNIICGSLRPDENDSDGNSKFTNWNQPQESKISDCEACELKKTCTLPTLGKNYYAKYYS
jgi:Ion channel